MRNRFVKTYLLLLYNIHIHVLNESLIIFTNLLLSKIVNNFYFNRKKKYIYMTHILNFFRQVMNLYYNHEYTVSYMYTSIYFTLSRHIEIVQKREVHVYCILFNTSPVSVTLKSF